MARRVIPGVTKPGAQPTPAPARPGVKGPPRHIKGSDREALWWLGEIVGAGFAVVAGCVKLAILLCLLVLVLRFM